MYMDDKQLLIEKYGLIHENNAWYSEKENAHKHLIFKDAFFERADIIGLLFRINKLCIAKVNYFRRNIDRYEPLRSRKCIPGSCIYIKYNVIARFKSM